MRLILKSPSLLARKITSTNPPQLASNTDEWVELALEMVHLWVPIRVWETNLKMTLKTDKASRNSAVVTVSEPRQMLRQENLLDLLVNLWIKMLAGMTPSTRIVYRWRIWPHWNKWEKVWPLIWGNNSSITKM